MSEIHSKIKRSANRTVYIHTPLVNGGLKAWHLRDFVKALDEAGVPDDAKLTAHRDSGTMHFNGISVHHTEDIEGWPEADVEAAPSTTCRSDCDEIPGYCASKSGCLGPAAPSTPEEPE